MMHTATIEEIQAYQADFEKGKITPDKLPPCSRCREDSCNFKIHAFRERQFWLLVEMLVKKVFCALIRYKCPSCKKTVTYYPPFAISYKRYTYPTINALSRQYVEMDNVTYKTAIMIDWDGVGHPGGNILSASTVHRWITTLSGFGGGVFSMLNQKKRLSSFKNELSGITVAKHKYRSGHRKNQLVRCRKLWCIESLLSEIFGNITFTNFAINIGFG